MKLKLAFQAVQYGQEMAEEPCHLDTADLDLDGNLEIVVRDTINGEYQLLRGLGGYDFLPELMITDDPVSFCPVFLEDLDFDGRVDLFSANYGEQTTSLHRNLTLTGVPFRRGDVNLDGSTNVADAISVSYTHLTLPTNSRV